MDGNNPVFLINTNEILLPELPADESMVDVAISTYDEYLALCINDSLLIFLAKVYPTIHIIDDYIPNIDDCVAIFNYAAPLCALNNNNALNEKVLLTLNLIDNGRVTVEDSKFAFTTESLICEDFEYAHDVFYLIFAAIIIHKNIASQNVLFNYQKIASKNKLSTFH